MLLYLVSFHFTSLHFTSLHLHVLHFTSLHFTSLHFTSLHFTSLHFTSLYCFISLHYTASLRFISLHFTILTLPLLHFTSALFQFTILFTILTLSLLQFLPLHLTTTKYCYHYTTAVHFSFCYHYTTATTRLQPSTPATSSSYNQVLQCTSLHDLLLVLLSSERRSTHNIPDREKHEDITYSDKQEHTLITE